MPAVQVSYPGVYVVELPSGTHTITGVPTSITAFVGTTARGPLNKPVTINSPTDYNRQFGGLAASSSTSFAIRDFYANGGSQAVIVRLYNKGGAGVPTAIIDVPSATPGPAVFQLVAANPGAWGTSITVVVDKQVTTPTPYGLADGQVFNLTISDGTTTEVHRNVTLVGAPQSPRALDVVLANESSLARWPKTAPDDLVSIGEPAPASFEAVFTPMIAALAGSATIKGDVAKTLVVSDGIALAHDQYFPSVDPTGRLGVRALATADLFNILVIPPPIANNLEGDLELATLQDAATYAAGRRAIFIVDPPSTWTTKSDAKDKLATVTGLGDARDNSALYFPRIQYPNPFDDNRLGTFAPSGAVAGIIARTDATRGVWKAPAGLEATVNAIQALSVDMTDAENGELNPLGINCLRNRPAIGPVVWGARTINGDDRLTSQWKYLPVRRLALFLEESLFRGTQWVVFEPNDEPLWSQIRTNITAFMQNLFLQGAFQGSSPDEAYFVKCDDETTTQQDIDSGIVNIVVGFAPLKPAEFVVLSLQQMSGQTA
ncbi:MAG TPA: phage tail sheath subtilisin-like domain-containing protein [Kofleriaceae bacterium]